MPEGTGEYEGAVRSASAEDPGSSSDLNDQRWGIAVSAVQLPSEPETITVRQTRGACTAMQPTPSPLAEAKLWPVFVVRINSRQHQLRVSLDVSQTQTQTSSDQRMLRMGTLLSVPQEVAKVIVMLLGAQQSQVSPG